MIKRNSVVVYMERRWQKGGYSFYITASGLQGEKLRLPPSIWVESPDIGFEAQESLEMTEQEVQGLFEELWRSGFRPTTNVEGVGELRATKEHLKDMRALVGKQLDISLL